MILVAFPCGFRIWYTEYQQICHAFCANGTGLRRSEPHFAMRNSGLPVGWAKRRCTAALAEMNRLVLRIDCGERLFRVRGATCDEKLWLGRQDSNLGWRDQNPLPYRLATPQLARWVLPLCPCPDARQHRQGPQAWQRKHGD